MSAARLALGRIGLPTPAFPALFFFPSIFVFYFCGRCEWSVALGINDMTRDTLLLEFSQVRAAPIEEAQVPLCLARRGKEKEKESLSRFLSPSLFCCSFNL